MIATTRPIASRSAAMRLGESVFKELGLIVPTDLGQVAKHLKATVLEEPAPAGVSGALVMKDGKPIVLANSSHVPVRRRFTIAHELGHLAMHVDPQDWKRATRVVLFRDARASQGVVRREIQANAFAAGLLMPQTEVRRRVVQPLGHMDVDDIQELADQFQVSTEAMTVRLKDLGLWAA